MQQPYTDQEMALIEAIHAAPRDDQPRLAYADWLEQHGAGDYAEFIRLQCQQPYIGIEGKQHPRESLSWDSSYKDKAWSNRLQRLIDLFPGIYRTDRFASLAELLFHEEFYRGLPVLTIEDGDCGMPMRVVNGNSFNLPPLARVDLSLHTYQSRLAEWLNHPLMFRVDVLRIWLHPADENEPDEEEEDKDWDVEFMESDIRLLANWPLLDRLETLNLCRSISPFAEELVEELLRPRVDVDTDYGSEF